MYIVDIKEMDIKKKRVMVYFIEAAREVLSSCGVDGITIRKIAGMAGYNSATLYNYFDDLQHLVLFASISYLREYVSALSNNLRPCKNAKERYQMVYVTFDYFSFRSPEIFYNMFFGSQKAKLTDIITVYYDLFPDEIKNHTDAVRGMLTQGNMYLRDKPLVTELAKEGFIKDDRVTYLYEIMPRVHQSYLHEMLDKNLSLDPDAQHRKFIDVFDYLVKTAE